MKKKSSPAKVEANVFFTTLRKVYPYMLSVECRVSRRGTVQPSERFLEMFTFHKSAYLRH